MLVRTRLSLGRELERVVYTIMLEDTSSVPPRAPPPFHTKKPSVFKKEYTRAKQTEQPKNS